MKKHEENFRRSERPAPLSPGQRSALSPACELVVRIGSRWSLLVLLSLERDGTLRFNELQRAVPGGVSDRMLAATLDGLERCGLLLRTVYPEVPPRVTYALTAKGRSLMPLLHGLLEWAEANG